MGREISDSEILRFLDAVNAQLRRSGVIIHSVRFSRVSEARKRQIEEYRFSESEIIKNRIKMKTEQTMDYKKKYLNALEAVRKMQETNPHDEGLQNWVNDNFPELAESEDERIRKELIRFHKSTIDIDGIKGS